MVSPSNSTACVMGQELRRYLDLAAEQGRLLAELAADLERRGHVAAEASDGNLIVEQLECETKSSELLPPSPPTPLTGEMALARGRARRAKEDAGALPRSEEEFPPGSVIHQDEETKPRDSAWSNRASRVSVSGKRRSSRSAFMMGNDDIVLPVDCEEGDFGFPQRSHTSRTSSDSRQSMLRNNIELRPEWSNVGNSSGDVGSTGARQRMCSLPTFVAQKSIIHSTNTAFQEMLKAQGCLRHLVSHPSSPHRVAWDAFSLFVVAYDVLTLPLQAFNFDTMHFARPLRICTTTFWTIDIIATFFTGYHQEGVVVGLPKKIAIRYLTRTFLLDLAIVTVDWVLLGSEQEASGAVDLARAGKVFRGIRLLRILRLIRLLRIMKFVHVSDRLGDLLVSVLMYSEGIMHLLGILKLLLTVSLINHFIACSWYALGTMRPTSETWVKTLEEENASMIMRYCISFHWSLCQFTPAPVDFHPVNVEERIFAIGVLLFGFTMFSSFLGNITTLLTHIRTTADKRAQDDMHVREFLSQNSVTLQLGNRIITFLRHCRVDNHKRVIEKEAQALLNLPVSLLQELRFEVYSKSLVDHPLFWQLTQEDNQAFMVDVCHEAMTQVSILKGHELFAMGEVAVFAYSLASGSLSYAPWGSLILEEVLDPETLNGPWLSEPALWVQWRHVGRATAVAHATVTAMSADKFGSVAQRYADAVHVCAAYARFLTRALEELEYEDFNDMWNSKDLAREFAQKALEETESTLGVDKAPSLGRGLVRKGTEVDRAKQLFRKGKTKESIAPRISLNSVKSLFD